MKDIETVVGQLAKTANVTIVKDVIVKNAITKDMQTHTRVGLVVNKNVPQMVQSDEDGTYSEGLSNLVFVSDGSIRALLGEHEELAFAKNILRDSPKLLELVLSYAKVNLLLERVPEGTKYVNPFSDKEVDTNLLEATEHNSIYTHITKITLGKKGIAVLKRIEDEMIAQCLKSALSGGNNTTQD